MLELHQKLLSPPGNRGRETASQVSRMKVVSTVQSIEFASVICPIRLLFLDSLNLFLTSEHISCAVLKSSLVTRIGDPPSLLDILKAG